MGFHIECFSEKSQSGSNSFEILLKLAPIKMKMILREEKLADSQGRKISIS